MSRSSTVGYAAFAAMAQLFTLSSHVQGQVCFKPERQFVRAPVPVDAGERFGHAVVISGDRALVSSPVDDSIALNGGAVFAMEQQAGTWVITQTLGAGQVTANDRFGQFLALHEDLAVVGVPLDSPGTPSISAAGSAYVFRHVAGIWVFEQQLVAGDPNINDNFGSSVDVQGDAIIIGAPNDDEGGNANAGAAYVFTHNGSAWVQEQKIMESGSSPSRRVGVSVAIDGDLAFVARNPGPSFGADGVIVWRRNAGTWIQQQMLTSPDTLQGDMFGLAIDFHSGTLVVGASSHDLPSLSDAGAAYTFTENDVMFSFEQKLVAVTPAISDRFGTSVAIEGENIVIGSPNQNILPFPMEVVTQDAGAIHVFERTSASWIEQFAGRAKARFTWSDFNDQNVSNCLGFSVALSGNTVVAGGPLLEFAADTYGLGGKALFFDVEGRDCDRDGVPDSCEADCNFNLVPDDCEVAGGDAGDCNLNGVPDSCDSGYEYAIDSSTPLGGAWGAAVNPLDIVWLNQFTVLPGGQRLTHVAITWLAYGPANLPGQVVIYSDPNGDGHPSDAVLLATHPMSLIAEISTGSGTHTVYRVPTTYVGEPGDSFFIGGHMTLPPQTFVAVIDNSATPGHSNWRLIAPPNSNIANLSTGWTFNVAGGDWAVRGVALDCNGNGVWDACDIATASSFDANANGIPDECETTSCEGDVSGDNQVNVTDLLGVIGDWGACDRPCPPHCNADTNGDCSVNVTDLLAVIGNWGPCP